MENVRKGEIACNKQLLLFSQCFLPYMALIFHFKCTLKCRLQYVSIWINLKFCRLVMGEMYLYYTDRETLLKTYTNLFQLCLLGTTPVLVLNVWANENSKV